MTSNPKRRCGFTLVEILVVVIIVMLVSAVVIPQVIGALNGRQVSEAARILQAALAGARDAAIRANAPRGIRLLPDPILTTLSFKDAAAQTIATGTTVFPGQNTLAYNRLQSIELAGDYTSGAITIGPMLPPGMAMPGFPTPYVKGGGTYPYFDSTSLSLGGSLTTVLMIEESPFVGGYVVGGAPIRNEPTSWYWNIRVGDKIRPNDSGQYYTVVGPCTVNPYTSGGANSELFVNVGIPGTASPLVRTYYTTNAGTVIAGTFSPEFLFLVNGQDDPPLDGYADNGWDGFDNPPTFGVSAGMPNGVADDWAETIQEQERWLGVSAGSKLSDVPPVVGPYINSPTGFWIATSGTTTLQDRHYAIRRRPVPVEGARETAMPSGVVIDATTWNTTQERSRLPIDPFSLAVDILVNANGQVVPTTLYGVPTGANALSFYHFWVTERTDVQAPTLPAGVYHLPMPKGTAGGYISTGFDLKSDRRLITLFTKSGLINTDTVENFSGSDVNAPFYDAQLGSRGTK